MDLDPKKILKTLNPRRIWVPVLFGLGIVSYLFISDPDVTIDNFALIFNASLIIPPVKVGYTRAVPTGF